MNPFKSNKILAHLPMLADYQAGNPYPPIGVQIDPTNACASDCPWCAGFLNRRWSKAQIFTDEQLPQPVRDAESVTGLYGLIDELQEMGVQSVTWTGGGEPAQFRGLEAVVSYAAMAGLQQGLITHGVVDVSPLLEHLTWVRFSVDAATRQLYELQHRTKNFEIVLANVGKAAKAKHFGDIKCTVGVAFVTGEMSKHEIGEFAAMWQGVPIDYIQFHPLYDVGDDHWLSDNGTTLQQLTDAQKAEPRVVFTESKYRGLAAGAAGKTKHCHGTFFEVAIAADSLVYPCCHHKGKPELSIGDLRQESFADVWRRHQESRRYVVHDQCPAYCRHHGTNDFIESEVLTDRTHRAFI